MGHNYDYIYNINFNSMFYGTPNRQIVNLFDQKNILNNHEALIPGIDPLGVKAGPAYKMPQKAGFSHMGDHILPYGLQKATNAVNSSTIRVSMTGQTMDTNTGNYRLVKTRHKVLPMANTLPGELLFKRKPVILDNNKAILRGSTYISSVINTATQTYDAMYSSIPGPGNSAYAIDTALQFGDYGAVTSLSHLLQLLRLNAILNEDNYATTIIRDFYTPTEIISNQFIRSQWDPVRIFINNFQPVGLFARDLILGGVQSDSCPYEMAIITHGQPYHAANEAFHDNIGQHPPIGQSFGLLLRKSLFIDIDQYSQNQDPNLNPCSHSNLFLLLYRIGDFDIAFKIVKTRHTVQYIHHFFKQYYKSSYDKYIQFRNNNLSLSRHQRQLTRHLFSAVYRLGYIPKAPKGHQNICSQNNYVQFKTFILTLGNEWETN